MKNLMGLLLLAVMNFHALAQNSDRTLMTIGNEEVSVDDFLVSTIKIDKLVSNSTLKL